MEQSGQQYDEASTIFSPDGRLYQVEYAREAIKKGSTTMGFKCKEGILLLAHKPERTRLINLKSLEKIYQIDDHIACATTGLSPDGRHLVELAREEAQWHKIRYDEPIPLKNLVHTLCEYEHMYTRFDGVRPFGVVLLIGGLDNQGEHLYSTDPSGAYLGYKAVCEGKKSTDAMNHFTKLYTVALSLDQTLQLGLETLKKITKHKLNVDMIDAVAITKQQGYHKISRDVLEQALGKHSS